MSKNNRKRKKCPCCDDGFLLPFIENIRKGWITYSEKYLRCNKCDYSEKIRIKGNHKDLELR